MRDVSLGIDVLEVMIIWGIHSNEGGVVICHFQSIFLLGDYILWDVLITVKGLFLIS